MAVTIQEEVDTDGYFGKVIVDRRDLLARLAVGRDREAELAALLMGAARSGVLRLDRILPFLRLPGDQPTRQAEACNLDDLTALADVMLDAVTQGAFEIPPEACIIVRRIEAAIRAHRARKFSGSG
jgi:hypothetical protein